MLGPRLFATYVNNLPDHVTSGELYMHADDTTIYVVILQEVLDQVKSWSLENRLVVPEGKSEGIISSTKPFIGPMKPSSLVSSFDFLQS